MRKTNKSKIVNVQKLLFSLIVAFVLSLYFSGKASAGLFGFKAKAKASTSDESSAQAEIYDADASASDESSAEADMYGSDTSNDKAQADTYGSDTSNDKAQADTYGSDISNDKAQTDMFASNSLTTIKTTLQTYEPGSSTESVKNRENKTLDLLSRIDAFSEDEPNLKMDAAKAHYNMGNIYFEKGEYEIAVREYYQAVTLMPDDPDAHYNLAFVSGEYLNDQTTALKHYQMYLFLKPDAEDRAQINEKIISSKLILGGVIDSVIDKQQ